ncbi:MAG: gamma-glutamyltransferase [Candidatus Tectomicrobia bacterium]|nr:gamma-glutamyltransferase [Candidatus Tectomicrobia bacterium]
MAFQSRWQPNKEEVVVENGIVAAKHPLAAEAGLEMLKKGGNAVDAAVATGFTICVVEPYMTCIAGCGYMLIHLAEQGGKNLLVEYSPRAPKKATPDMYKVIGQGTGISVYEVEGEENNVGYRSICVPATTAGLCLAHKRFGTLPLEQVMEPAIHYAEHGVEASWYTTLMIANSMDSFLRYPASAAVFLPKGVPPKHAPKPAEKVVQKDLAQTLKKIAREGHDGLYHGEIAAAIEEDMKKNGGLVTREDLAAYEAVIIDPARIKYRGYEILGVPVANGGITALQTLNILENFDLTSLGHNTPDYLHLFIEAARHAFADRYHYIGDPDYVSVPMKGLLSREYAKELSQQISRERAALEDEQDVEPWVAYSMKALHDPWKYDSQPRPTKEFAASAPGDGDCTTHFGVVDKHRNLVSCTQTAVGGFGSKVITPGTGVLFNNGMVWFNPKPGYANSVAGYKKPMVNMAPLLVLKGGKPYLSIGAPGGRRIINCNTQVALNIIDHQMSVQEAIAAPRVDASGKQTLIDSRLDESIVESLSRKGHQVSVVEETAADANFATPLAIMVNEATGKVHSGVDVFRIAEARGY